MTRWSYAGRHSRLDASTGWNADRYRQWRIRIPYTDAEIADQLARDADAVQRNPQYAAKLRSRANRARQGDVSSSDVGRVLDALIRDCAICGKKALYRTGHEGRCSTHRLVQSAAAAHRVARIEAHSTAREHDRKIADHRDLARTRWLRTSVAGRTHTK